MDTKLLRQKILDLAIHGKLVPQNPQHEPASVLLEKIRGESLPLATAGKPSSATPSAGSNATRNARSNSISEDEIPFEIPENWCWCRLNEIYNFIDYRGVTPNKTADGVPLVTAKNVRAGYIDYTIKEYISEQDYESRQGRGSPKKGDLLFTTEAPLGYCAIADLEKFSPGQRIITFQQYTESELLCNKLYQFFILSDFFQKELLDNKTGTTVSGIKSAKLKLLYIPLPPLEEQKLIVEEIERIFALIDTIEQNNTDLETVIKQTKSKILDLAIHGKLVPQDKADESASKMLEKLRAENTTKAGASGREKIAKGQLKRDKNDSYIYKSADGKWLEKKADGSEEEIEVPFEIPESWCWCRLKEIANIARGGSPRPIEDFITDDENGINWIKIGDTKEGDKYITSVREKIKPEGIRHSRFVHSGDFLLTNSMSFGHPYILKVDGCIHDGWLVFADIGQVIDSDFLYYSLSSDFIYTAFSFVAAGSTVKNLKSETVKETLFPLPPLEEQKRIVNKIEEAINKIDSILHSLGV